MKTILASIILSLLLSLTTANVAGDDNNAASLAFDQMKPLVGYWKRANENNAEFKIHFELTANETVLVETWLYKNTKHSMTLYHRDGNSLLATHYCPQGNQPRLQMKHIGQANNIVFEFRDATNLQSLNDSHQHSLRFNLMDGNNAITRGETYLSEKGEETTELILERIEIDPANKRAN